MAKVKTLPVEVYRWSLGDCTNSGISSRHNKLYLICPDGWFEMDEQDERLIKLVYREIGGKPYVHAEPVNDPHKKEIAYMSGGNFIYSCDGRFPHDYPISLHDRSETQEEYDILSR